MALHFLRTRQRKYIEPLVVCDYNPIWAANFKLEQQNIHKAIGSLVVSIGHIGSTSIPGMAAKPIIDIEILVNDFSQLNQCIQGMDHINYVHKGQCGIEGREYFRKLGYHAHMVQVGSDEHLRKKMFLDYLRNNEDARNEYVELKRSLAKKWFERINGQYHYNLEKTGLILDILGRAGWDLDNLPPYLIKHRNEMKLKSKE
ncbi:hypothetical protein LPJ66_003009 [Kickxella alabastrina]|uniref:Uncharacterized protein n=1 Tax=Kickxella alabastrina TaxID=61397 RepID=A0ACC1ILC6_9FUNG|nr:hypothetical protein LPJ66_003009 [Kickxella alabastrina]